MTVLTLNAPSLYADLRSGVRELLQRLSNPASSNPGPASLVGIWSGGAWLAEQLQRDLGWPGECGVISSALHRDDYRSRGLASGAGATRLPFEIEGRHIVLVDDVLYTGRTIRAVVNELFDFGRPASVSLAVLVDRGGRELPIEPTLAAARLTLPASQRLSLAQDEAGALSFEVETVD